MKKYKVFAKVETIKKCYTYDYVIELDFENISPYAVKSIVIGDLYQEVQNYSKNDIFIKIKELKIELL